MNREIDKMRDRMRTAPLTVNEDGSTYVPAPLPQLGAQPGGFFTFRYSSTEIFSQGGDLHVKMQETRYQDGRLTSEQCEGTLERQAYERMLNQAQNYFLNRMVNFVRLFY